MYFLTIYSFWSQKTCICFLWNCQHAYRLLGAWCIMTYYLSSSLCPKKNLASAFFLPYGGRLDIIILQMTTSKLMMNFKICLTFFHISNSGKKSFQQEWGQWSFLSIKYICLDINSLPSTVIFFSISQAVAFTTTRYN